MIVFLEKKLIILGICIDIPGLNRRLFLLAKIGFLFIIFHKKIIFTLQLKKMLIENYFYENYSFAISLPLREKLEGGIWELFVDVTIRQF